MGKKQKPSIEAAFQAVGAVTAAVDAPDAELQGAAPPAAPAEPAASVQPLAALSRFQQFTIERIHRSLLKNAPYNPRVLSEKARQKLRKVIEKHGLVEPLVWNRRSDNLVGGHQRISVIDSLEKTSDYTIDVAVIDVDPKKERELNIALNNQEAAGTWDLGKLEAMFKEEIDLDATGFGTDDIYQLFGNAPLIANPEALQTAADKVRAARAQLDKTEKKQAFRDDPNFYCVVIFQDVRIRNHFLRTIGCEEKSLRGRPLPHRQARRTPRPRPGNGSDVRLLR